MIAESQRSFYRCIQRVGGVQAENYSLRIAPPDYFHDQSAHLVDHFTRYSRLGVRPASGAGADISREMIDGPINRFRFRK